MAKNKFKSKYVIFIIIALFFVFIGFNVIYNKNIQTFYQIAKIYKNGKHLIIFQNNAELRPTGGFIGSFAQVDMKNYKPENIFIETNIYKRDNKFSHDFKFDIKDAALKNLLPDGNLAMRDSNWEIDFHEASKNIAWFYQEEDGEKVDTITAINAEVLKNIIEIIGPIKMVKYDVIINTDNFYETVQYQVEDGYYQDKDNLGIHEPKSILSEMMPIIIARLKKPSYALKLYYLILDSLINKDIQIFSYDNKTNEIIKNNNWGGIIYSTNGDYLNINHANIGSDKTSIYTNENIVYEVSKKDDQIIAKLNIKTSIDKNNYDPGNKIFTRVLIPDESKIEHITENKKEITNIVDVENVYGYKCIRYYDVINPDFILEKEINYILPFDTLDNYKLKIQKQSGAQNQNIKVIINGKSIYEGPLEKDIDLTYKHET